MFRNFFLILVGVFFIFSEIEATHTEGILKTEASTKKKPSKIHPYTVPSKYVSGNVWKEVQPYLMPEDHPAKKKLDKIFKASRALLNMKSMQKAGFAKAKPQHHTQVIVTRHPDLKGYVIKAYLDSQKYHSEHPENYFWVKRARGARLIQESIKEHHLENFVKVPKKWIYLIPDDPSPPVKYLRKNFILVEQDMDIYDSKTNKKLWRSKHATKAHLNALYIIITELGFFDCAKPDNCPFSRDGKIALIDTQTYFKKRVKYHKLTPFLNSEKKVYWRKLVKEGIPNKPLIKKVENK